MSNRRNRSRVMGSYEGILELGGNFWPVTTRDISLNGAMIQINLVLPLNTECRLMVPLSDEIEMVFEASVVRVSGNEAALQFVGMDEETYHHLSTLIRLRSENADVIDSEELQPR